jgi:peroxiredoxin
MSDQPTSLKPLPYGELAPAFTLMAANGDLYKREQFRGKAGLVLIFFAAPSQAESLLAAVAGQADEYAMLNAKVFGISPASQTELARLDEALTFPLLCDNDQQVWHRYSHTAAGTDYGYAVFVLDTYGAVEAQRVVAAADSLPNAADILAWTQGAQYKCNI